MNKKLSILVVLILTVSLNVPMLKASALKNISWWSSKTKSTNTNSKKDNSQLSQKTTDTVVDDKLDNKAVEHQDNTTNDNKLEKTLKNHFVGSTNIINTESLNKQGNNLINSIKNDNITNSYNSSDINKEELIIQSEEQKVSYALGVSFGQYLQDSFDEQQKLNIVVNKKYVLRGIHDVLEHKELLIPAKEIQKILQKFESDVKNSTENFVKNQSKVNIVAGKKFVNQLIKNKKFKKTRTGLVYKIYRKGKLQLPKKGKIFVKVNYIGKLISGVEFDNTYIRKQPLIMDLHKTIPGWQEGLRLIGKGGKITLVIPYNLAYNHDVITGIPTNSTLVFDIELLDFKYNVSSFNRQQHHNKHNIVHKKLLHATNVKKHKHNKNIVKKSHQK
ncbi:FKBP-type peptidyl-prolyl cis-trans isomerase [Enterobacteriaceae endosymbiont of Macroplea appendiculata]|uniref:FKBP-type peptidyl-prolyl cis-trans isomerase n=1 Tax=Enterobacteriaceae endosymbiont of Macroplea appendiculata TaxID=2675790 RepID=UPI001457112B|nr:FKBP-type peptidyl-prolyl cis-trans isomerase [Enterobacteriaceae endosymbiont of Macroplea appendiculata]